MFPMCPLSPEQASGQATSCCLTWGWGHLPIMSLVPRMSHDGVTHLLLGLGMGSLWCPQCVPCPQVEPAAVATLPLPDLGTGMCPQHGVSSVPNMSPLPRMRHLAAATCLQPFLGTRTCPHCGVPSMFLVCPQHVPQPQDKPLAAATCLLPGSGMRKVSSPHCPQFVLLWLSPACPQCVPQPWEKLLAVATYLPPDSGPGPQPVLGMSLVPRMSRRR